MVTRIVLKELPCPPFMILFPALGLPAIANDGVIDVIALVKKNSNLLKPTPAEGPVTDQTVKQRIVERIVESLRYVAWSDKDEAFNSRAAKKIELKWIEDVTWVSVTKSEEKPLTYKIEFEDPLHQLTLRISGLVLKKFDPIYETTMMLRFHVKLADGEGLYNLVPLFDESSFVIGILKSLKSPGNHTTAKKSYKKDIKIYHPFQITSKKFLSIAHVADVHISTHWNIYERVAGTIKSVARASKRMGKSVYNNYNTRFEDLFEDINTRARPDIVVMGGDLIDYNRGAYAPCARNDYLFNANWIYFYDLLVKNYRKPVFTLLGNHEYLLNPYPTYIDFPIILAKFPLLGIPINWALSYFWNMSSSEGPFAADMNLTADEAKEIDVVEKGPKLSASEAKKLMDLRKAEAREKKKDVRSELERMIEALVPEQVDDKGSGTWYACEEAALWYFLVINPFKDYLFSHKEMAFLMVDWNVEMDVGTLLLLPSPTKCLSPEQMKMVDELRSRKKARYRIFCSHAPVLSSWPELGNFYLAKARKKWDLREIEDYPFLKHDSRKFDWGALEEKSRTDLINKIISRDRIDLCLSGHSHTNKVFQIEEKSKRKKLVFLRREIKEDQKPFYKDEKVIEFSGGSWDSKSPVIIVTTSGGPIARTSEVSMWDDLIQPGYRVINFDDKGRISTKLVNLNVSIRPEAIEEAVENDPGSGWYREHPIKRVQIFSSSLPSSQIPTSAIGIPGLREIMGEPIAVSVLIEKVSGIAAKIDKLDAGRVIVVKKIPRSARLTIDDNKGAIVVQRNEGSLVINDNNKIVNVDENRGWVQVNQNDNTIVVHENGRPGGSWVSGHVVIYSNGTGSPGDDVVRVYDNFGCVGIYDEYKRPDGTIVKTSGNDDLVAVRRNSGWLRVGYNDDTVEIGVNSKYVDIHKNTGGRAKWDSDIFIFKNEETVTFYGNEGDIHVFDNSAGELNVTGNSRTIKVSNSKRGKITGAKKGTVDLDSESDVRSEFENREQDQKPLLE